VSWRKSRAFWAHRKATLEEDYLQKHAPSVTQKDLLVLTGDAAHPDAHAHAQHAAAEDTHTHDDDGEAQEILSDGDEDAALSAWLDDPDTGVSGSDAVDAAFAMFAGGEDDDGLFGFLDEPDTTTLTPTEPKKTVAAPDGHAHTGTRLTDEFSVFEDNMPSTSTLNVCIAGLGTRVCVCVLIVYMWMCHVRVQV
jgi:hypothetical protein